MGGITGNLWEKNLVKIENVTDDGIKTISEGCKQLIRLNLNHCINISNQSIKYLAKTSEHLAVLEIFGCHKITMAGLIEGQKQREELGFVNLRSITFNTGSVEEQRDFTNKWNQYNNSIKDKSKKTKLYNHPKPKHCSPNQSNFSFAKAIVSF